MGHLRQMGKNEPLPVEIQHILAAGCGKGQAAARFSRLQQQVHLRIMPQRLKVAHALHRGLDRLPVYDAAVRKGHFHIEPIPDQSAQHLDLDLAHDPGMDLAAFFFPHNGKRGIFFRQLL